MPSFTSNNSWLIWFFASGVAWVWTQDWLVAASILVLSVVWLWLHRLDVLPVLAVALTFQWAQITIGLIYSNISGRELLTAQLVDLRPMVLVGLGCLFSLLVGLFAGSRVGPRTYLSHHGRSSALLSWPVLIALYVLFAGLSGAIKTIAWDVSGLTQGILAVSSFRFCLLFMILRRLLGTKPRWFWFSAILGFEIVTGYAGFFAGFREPAIIAWLCCLEIFDRRQLRHWAMLIALSVLIPLSALVWTSLKVDYRAEISADRVGESVVERLTLLSNLAGLRFEQGLGQSVGSDVDRTVSRMWAVYYPALAIERVPEVIPHTNGRIISSALRHLFTPRLLFPDKPSLASDSEMIRTYSGVMVAGAESNTSIAFGYAAESYVDFGIPLMFVPIVVFGVVMGIAYRVFSRLIKDQELRMAFLTVTFWLSLYLFERSWIKMLGNSITLMLFLGGAVIVLDRWLLRHPKHARQ